MKTKLKSLCHSALRTLALVASIAFAAPDAVAGIASGAGPTAFEITSAKMAGETASYFTFTVKSKSSTVAASQQLNLSVYKVTTKGATTGGTQLGTPQEILINYAEANKEYVKYSQFLLREGYYYYKFDTTSSASITITSVDVKNAGSVFNWVGGTSGAWGTASNWTMAELGGVTATDVHQVPAAEDSAYIRVGAAIDLSATAYPVPSQITFYNKDIAFYNGSFREDNGGSSAPGSAHFFVKQCGAFNSINFTTGTQSDKYSYIHMLDKEGAETYTHTNVFKSVTASQYMSLSFYNYAKKGNTMLKFVDTDTTFGDLHGYTSDTVCNNNILLENSCVSFASFKYGANVSGGTSAGQGTTTTDKAAIKVKLGATNSSEKASFAVRGEYVVISGSTLAIDASMVGAGSYKIFSAATLTSPANLKVTSLRMAGGKTKTINTAFSSLATTTTDSSGSFDYSLAKSGNTLTLTVTFTPMYCSYLTTDGKGWFDLGFKPHLRNTRFEIVSSVQKDYNANALAWAHSGTDASEQYCVGIAYWSKNKHYTYYATTDQTGEHEFASAVTIPDEKPGVHTVTAGGQDDFIVDNWRTTVGAQPKDHLAGETMTLFKELISNFQWCPTLSLYSVKVWDGSTLVHNFVPIEGGCLYDTVDEKPVFVQGETAVFTTGNDTAIAVPTPTTSFEYDGTEKKPLPDSDQYTLVGDASATIPGHYFARVVPNVGYCWSGAAEGQEHAPVDISWEITGRWDPQPTDWGTSNMVYIAGKYYCILTYTNTNASGFSWTVPNTADYFDFLVVAGGGGGGSGNGGTVSSKLIRDYCRNGGGGGAGGVVTGRVVNASGTFTVKVGAGGARGASLGANGSPGGNSSLALGSVNYVTAVGGGYGGGARYVGTSDNGSAGGAGGSGGGGSSKRTTSAGTTSGGSVSSATIGTAVTIYKAYGNAGGKGYDKAGAGGGGGACGVGESAASGHEVCGAGGAGLTLSIGGETVTYGCGGTAGAGRNAQNESAAAAALTGNGGVGGRGVYENTGYYGEDGGSGVVVIRYEVPYQYYQTKALTAFSWDGDHGGYADVWYRDVARNNLWPDHRFPNDSMAEVHVGFSGSLLTQTNSLEGGTYSLDSLMMEGGTVLLDYGYLVFPSGDASKPIIQNNDGTLVLATLSLRGDGEIRGAAGTTTEFRRVLIADTDDIGVSVPLTAAQTAAVGVYANAASSYVPLNFSYMRFGAAGTSADLTISNTVLNLRSDTDSFGGDSALAMKFILGNFNAAHPTDAMLNAPSGSMAFGTGSTLDIEALSTVGFGTYSLISNLTCGTAANLTVSRLKLPDGASATIPSDTTLASLATMPVHGVTAQYAYTLECRDNVLVLELGPLTDFYWSKTASAHWDKLDSGKTYWYADSARSIQLTTYPDSADAQIHIGGSGSTSTIKNPEKTGERVSLKNLTMEGGTASISEGNYDFPDDASAVVINNTAGTLKLLAADFSGKGRVRCANGTTTQITSNFLDDDLGFYLDGLSSGNTVNIELNADNVIGYLQTPVSGSTAHVTVNSACVTLTRDASGTIGLGGDGKLDLDIVVSADTTNSPALQVDGALAPASGSTLDIDASAITAAGTYKILSYGSVSNPGNLAVNSLKLAGGTVTLTSKTLDNLSTAVAGMQNGYWYSLRRTEGVLTLTYLQAVAKPSVTTSFTYDGTEKTAGSAATGYVVSGDKQTNAGSYTFTATLSAGYCWADDGSTGVYSVGWSIQAASITAATAPAQTYTGSALTPAVTVTADSLSVPSSDYTIGTWSGDLINVGTYTATVTGQNNFKDTATVSFTINAKAITPTVTLSATTATYGASGWDTLPTVTVKDGETALASSTDYNVSWSPATVSGVGTYTVTVTLKGNYSGSNTATYTVTPATVTIPHLATTSAETNGVNHFNAPIDPAPSASTYSVTYPQGQDWTAPGTYTAVCSLPDTANYQWSDGTMTPKTLFFVATHPVPTARYRTVDYINSTSDGAATAHGQQYIDTGILPQDNIRATMRMRWLARSEASYMLAVNAPTSTGNSGNREGLIAANRYYWLNTLGSDSGIEQKSLTAPENDTDYELSTLFRGASQTYVVGSQTAYGTHTKFTPSSSNTRTLTLFGLNTYSASKASSDVQYEAIARLYACTISTNDLAYATALARDYVPVYDTETGTFGLWEKVEGTFAPSASDTPFQGGPTVALQSLSLSPASKTYDGTDVDFAALATLTDATGVAVPVNDGNCTLSYKRGSETTTNLKDAGTITVTITGKGLFTGSITADYTINPKEVGLSWGTTTFTYDGQPHVPTCTVTAGSLISPDTCDVTVKGEQKEVGDSYTATASTLSNGNYKLPTSNTTTFTISYGTYTITVAGGDGGTGGTAPDYTASSASQQVQMTALPTKTGYHITCWTVTGHTGADPTATTAGEITIPEKTFGNLTLTPTWTANTYNVRYMPKGGSGSMSNSTHTYDVSKALTPNTYERTGYTFIGWDTAGAGTTVVYHDGQSVLNLSSVQNANVDLCAVWQGHTHSVTYELNGGTFGASHPDSATYGTNFQVSPPTKTGYVFAGWKVTSGLVPGAAKWDTKSNPQNLITDETTVCGSATGTTWFINLNPNEGAAVTLTATWTVNTYGITYDLDGGEKSGTVWPTSEPYDTVFYISLPTKLGHTFAGWRVTSGLNPSTAKWGGTSSPNTTIENASTVCYNGTSAVFFKNLNTTPNGAVTLTATWTVNSYEITFDANGGTGGGCDKSSYTFSTAAQTATLTKPTYSDHHFKDWSVTGAGASESGDTLTIPANAAENITVTALWNTDITEPTQSGTLTYNGTEQTVTLTPTAAEGHYILGGVTSATAAGSYTATATPETGYCWSDGTTTAKDVDWKILPSLAEAVVTLSEPSTFGYDGAEHSVSVVSVTLNDITLTTSDYDVSGTLSATAAGTYTVTVTGKGDYGGSKTATWTITPKNVAELTWSVDYTNFWYTGTARNPTDSATWGGASLVLNTDFTVTNWNKTAKYNWNVPVGAVDTIVTNLVYGKGNYTGVYAVTTFKNTRQRLYWNENCGTSGSGAWNSEAWQLYNLPDMGNDAERLHTPNNIVAVYFNTTEGASAAIDLEGASNTRYQSINTTGKGVTKIHNGTFALEGDVSTSANANLAFEDVTFTNVTSSTKGDVTRTIWASGASSRVIYIGNNLFRAYTETISGKAYNRYTRIGFADKNNITNLFVNGETETKTSINFTGTTAANDYLIISNATLKTLQINPTNNKKLMFEFWPGAEYNHEGEDAKPMLQTTTMTFKSGSMAKVYAQGLAAGVYNILTCSTATDLSVSASPFTAEKMLANTTWSAGVLPSYETVTNADETLQTVRLRLTAVTLVDIPVRTYAYAAHTGSAVANPMSPSSSDGIVYTVTDTEGNIHVLDNLSAVGAYTIKAEPASGYSWSDGSLPKPRYYAFAIIDTARYQKIPFVRNNSGYIDTGITIQRNIKADLSFFTTAPKADACLLAGYGGGSNATYEYLLATRDKAKNIYAMIGDTTARPYGDYSDSGVSNRVVVALNTGTALTLVQEKGENASTNQHTVSSLTASDKTLYLFARNNNGTSDKTSTDFGLYGATIYTNGNVTAREYLPFLDTDSKQFGLYDIVTGEFKTSNRDGYPLLGPSYDFTWAGPEDAPTEAGDWNVPANWCYAGVGRGYSFPKKTLDNTYFTNVVGKINVPTASGYTVGTFNDNADTDITFYGDGTKMITYSKPYEVHGKLNVVGTTVGTGAKRFLSCGGGTPDKYPQLYGTLHLENLVHLPFTAAITIAGEGATVQFLDANVVQDQPWGDYKAIYNPNNVSLELAITNSNWFANYLETNVLGNATHWAVNCATVMVGVAANVCGRDIDLTDSFVALHNVHDPYYGDTVATRALTLVGNSKLALSDHYAPTGTVTFIPPAGGFQCFKGDIYAEWTNGTNVVTWFDMRVAYSGVAPLAVERGADFSQAAMVVDASQMTAEDCQSGGPYPLVRIDSTQGTLTVPASVAVKNVPAGYTGTVETVTANGVAGLDLVFKRDIAEVTFDIAPTTFVYNGAPQGPTVSNVKLGDVTLTEGTDFTVVNGTATDVGTYKLKLEGIGSYAGVTTLEKQWTITGALYVWTNGTGDGKWSTPGNWTPPAGMEGTYPDSKNKTAQFPEGTWTVDVDVSNDLYDFVLESGKAVDVKLTGTGTMRRKNGSVLSVAANQSLHLDGVRLTSSVQGQFSGVLMVDNCTSWPFDTVFFSSGHLAMRDCHLVSEKWRECWSGSGVTSPLYATNCTVMVYSNHRNMEFFHYNLKDSAFGLQVVDNYPPKGDVVLENSTLAVTNDVSEKAVLMKFKNVTIADGTSRFTATGDYEPESGGSWTFKVPAAGYATAPIQANNITIPTGHALAIDLSSVSAAGTYRLATATTALTIADDLPGLESHTTYTQTGLKAQLVLLDDGKTLAVEVKRDLIVCKATVQSPEAVEYTGSELSISFDVKGTFGGTEVTLTAGTDYEVSFTNKIGREESSTTYVATITGKGNYEGTLEAEYTILGRVFVWAGGDSTDNQWNDATKWDRVGSGMNHGWPGDDADSDKTAKDIPTFQSGAAYVNLPKMTESANIVYVRYFDFDPASRVTAVQNDKDAVYSATNSTIRGTVQEILNYAGPDKIRGHALGFGGDKAYLYYPVLEGSLAMDKNFNCPWGTAIWFGGSSSPTLSATDCTFGQSTWGYEFISFYCENDSLPVTIAMTNTIWLTTCGSKDANMVGRNVTWTYCNSTNLTGIIANHSGGSLTLDNSVVGFQNLHGTVAASKGHLPGGLTEEGDTFYATGLAFSGANTKFALSQNATVSGTVTFTMPADGFANDEDVLDYKGSFHIDTTFAGVAPLAVATNLDLSVATLTVDATAVATAPGVYPLVRVGEAGTLTMPSATNVTGVTGAYVGLVEATADGKGLDLVIANTVAKPTANTPLYYTGDDRTGVADGTGYTVTDGTKTQPGDYTATVSLAPDYRWADTPTDTNDLKLAWTILGKYKVTCDGLEVVVNKDWTDAALGVEAKQTPVQTKLNDWNNTHQLMKYWEVYVVGFSADKASEAAPVVQPVQTTDATKLRLNLGTDWPATSAQPGDSGVTVKYELHNAQTVGAEFNAIQTSTEGPQFDIPLSGWTSNVQYYRIRPVFSK